MSLVAQLCARCHDPDTWWTSHALTTMGDDDGEAQDPEQQEGQATPARQEWAVRQEGMTTYQAPPMTTNTTIAWLAAVLRDVAIVLAVVVYVIDTL